MTNDLTRREPGGFGDDGFHGSPNLDRLGSNYLKWTAAAGWRDRDGLQAPSPLLIFAIDEAVRMWKANKPTVIHDKPLPNLEELNAAISRSEWERGIDGQPRKPWEHIVVIRLVNLGTGEIYNYTAATTGAHIAYDRIKDQVITQRALRGTRVMPVVMLDDRAMRTAYGMGRRPHFEVISWKTPGGDGSKAVPKPDTPQLSGPAVAPVETTPAPTAAAIPAAPSPANGVTQPQPAKPKPKPAVNLTNETLNAMGDVKPVTMSEVMDDGVPW
jgi:hypothetical protein